MYNNERPYKIPERRIWLSAGDATIWHPSRLFIDFYITNYTFIYQEVFSSVPECETSVLACS
jgi:hypothetical protein